MIYVDALKLSVKSHKWQHDKNCRLVADDEKELHNFAATIGLNMLWFKRELAIPHYDLWEVMREKAVAAGAVEITEIQLIDMLIAVGKEQVTRKDETIMPTETNEQMAMEESRDFDAEKVSMAFEQPPLPHVGELIKDAFSPESISTALTDAEVKTLLPPVDVFPFDQTPVPVLAFDTETERISYQNPIPDLMCTTSCIAGDMRGSIKTPWEHRIDLDFDTLFKSEQHSVGHNVCFDLSILAFKYPDLLPLIFDALDRGTIHDTLIREKLLMLTLHGNFEMIEVNGCIVRLGYKLVDLEKKYLKCDRSHLKDDEDAPRLNYHIYKDVPLEKWAPEFVEYAIDDAINTGLIYQAQEIERQRCIEMTGYDPFAVEAFRVKVSFALRLLECVGERMDPEKVLEVTERFRTEYAQPRLREPLLAAGLLQDAIPPVPYANGALAHTDICNTNQVSLDHRTARKNKTCGCPPKMKATVKEKNPTKPLFQYIWNLAHKNPNIKAWPSDGCAAELRKEGGYDTVILDGAFMPYVIGLESIDASIATLRQKPLEQTPETKAAGLKKADITKNIANLAFAERCRAAGHTVLLPDDIKLKTDEEWSSTYASLDPLLAIWAERKALRKIITDYLPKMYYTDADGVERPAAVVRSSFYPLCLTGRSSSSASKLYPSRNGQNVDPRVRPCTIPREGNIIISTDYNGMELGTLAQKCVTLFGHSVMADNINKGIDNHAYLAAQIASHLDTDFAQYLFNEKLFNDPQKIYEAFAFLKTYKEPCGAPTFCENFKTKYRQEESKELDRPVLWSDFFKYYRLLAKPTGLGFPGGLGAVTMVAYAKGTYKVELSLEIAQKLRDVWLETYPEMAQYLDWIKKSCKDPHHSPIEIEEADGTKKRRTFFAYDTPRGMHRARCGFCEAANGAGLQAFSAEGALEGLYRTQKAMWLNDYDEDIQAIVDFLNRVDPTRVLSGAFLVNFLHDEELWESPDDNKAGQRVRIVENIMVEAMEEITPDVKAGAESAAMRRWFKKAEPIWDGDNIIPWEPEPAKKGI